MTMTPAVPLLQDYLSGSAARLPDKVALLCQRQRFTYRELDARANALAHALVGPDGGGEGLRPGDRVVIFLDNTVEAVVAFFGALKAGAVVSPVNPQTKADKLLYLLNDCRAHTLITDSHLAAVYREAAARAPHLRRVIVAGEGDAEAVPGKDTRSFASAVQGWQDRRDAPPQGRRRIDIDLAAIIYTSGSTGDAKGVMLTHRNMLTAATSITAYLRNTEDDVILGVLPLSFDYGLYQMIMAFRMGARLVLERSFAFPAQVLATMVEEGVTGFPGVPTIFAILAEMKSLSTYDLSRITYVTNTAAALSQKHIDFLQRTFPRARLYSMYGLTECKRCTYLPPEDLLRKPLSVGLPIPNTEVWVVDEAGRRLGPDQVGQLVVRGATVMRGYWEKPEATAERLRPGPLPGEQVLYTGDLCRIDEEGYVYFVSRMDDIIKSRGEKVAPREVEQAIVNLPGVKEVAVVGVPDEVLGQAVKAFVVAEAGVTLQPRDVLRGCQAVLENFMVPKYVEIVADLPKTSSGKITRRGLQ